MESNIEKMDINRILIRVFFLVLIVFNIILFNIFSVYFSISIYKY